MGAKRYSTEQIIVKLREAEIEMGRGVKVPEIRRLKALEQENVRLKKLLAETLIDNAILKEAASGNF